MATWVHVSMKIDHTGSSNKCLYGQNQQNDQIWVSKQSLYGQNTMGLKIKASIGKSKPLWANTTNYGSKFKASMGKSTSHYGAKSTIRENMKSIKERKRMCVEAENERNTSTHQHR
ncbi:unnamed protein product [Amaranthus hypochondriacus]